MKRFIIYLFTLGFITVFSTCFSTPITYADGLQSNQVISQTFDSGNTVTTYQDGSQVIGWSPTTPAGTYAVLNSNNEVTNIIVCTAAVCGGGTFAGNRVVLQVPTDPNGTGAPQGGYFAGNNSPNPVTYNPQNNTFNIPFAGGVLQAPSQPSIVTNADGTKTTIRLEATVGKDGLLQAPTSITGPSAQITLGGRTNSAGVSADAVTTDGEGKVLLTINQSTTLIPGLSQEQVIFLLANDMTNILLSANAVSLTHMLFALGY
jgi:hypothetical protein